VSNANETSNEDDSLEIQHVVRSKITVYKNLVLLGLMNMLINSAVVPLNVLVSSRAGEKLGNITFALNQIFSCLFSFVSVILMTSSTSKKKVLIIGNMCIVGFAACNWYISYYTLIPGSLLFGVGLATSWMVSLMYVNKLAYYYARNNQLNKSGTISYFTGILLAFSMGGFILGNGTSAGVLTLLRSDTCNATIMVDDVEDNMTECITNTDKEHSLSDNILSGIIVFYSLLALLIILLLLNNLEMQQNYKINCGVFMHAVKQIGSGTAAVGRLTARKEMLISIPIFYTSGISLGFVFSRYTKVSDYNIGT